MTDVLQVELQPNPLEFITGKIFQAITEGIRRYQAQNFGNSQQEQAKLNFTPGWVYNIDRELRYFLHRDISIILIFDPPQTLDICVVNVGYQPDEVETQKIIVKLVVLLNGLKGCR